MLKNYNVNIEIDDFQPYLRTCKLPIITIYKKPIDAPKSYVARLWDITRWTPYIFKAPTLKEVYKSIPKHLTRLERSPDDDKCIIETWI
jgi:hypothetical protein